MNYFKRSTLLLWLFLPLLTQAQQSLNEQNTEIGIFGGISNYMGDLAPDPVFKESHPSVGLNVKRDINGYFSYSFNLTYGRISGNDSNFTSLEPRGFKFRSDLYELSGQMEFNFFKFGNSHVRGAKRITPYLFTGISLFHFDPMAEYLGTWYHLQQENTEGQGFAPGAPAPYKLWQLSVPLGGGIKFNLSEQLNLLVLAGYRATFTSYLDDVGGNYVDKLTLINKKGNDVSAYFSDPTNIATNGTAFNANGLQRGNPDKKDWYMFYGITLSYIIPPPPCPRPF
jgi:hypothetical protein